MKGLFRTLSALIVVIGLLGTSCYPAALQAASPVAFTGVNLAGADFGHTHLPGIYGEHYIYPTHAEVDYFVGKGMNIFRLPFLWERLQRSLFGSFDADELARIDDFVNYATGKGATVLLDPHNYARYNDQVIGQGVSVDAFTDFWSKLATRYKSNPNVIFGLMNEPRDMPTELWRDNANAAIHAIRTTGATNLILVPGNGYTGAHSWYQDWYGTPNATVMLGITDPGNNYAFEVHQYLDGDSSGTSDQCISSTIGSERLRDFTGWLKQNGKRGFLGEFGGGRNDICYAALDNMLSYIDSNADVWLGWTYWAAGPWWGEYSFTLEPTNGTDRPQMAPLSKHVVNAGGTPPSPATLRIETGDSASYTDTTGNVWAADTGFVGGEMVDRGNIAIANTSNPRIYQTERWGMTSYELPVTNGSYTVKLHFAETYTGITGLGQRVFSVNVEGVTLGDIDIFAETGGINRALVKSVPVTVADGRLDLTFTASANNAAINGIEVIPGTAPAKTTARVEAGGNTSYTDTTGDVWAADTGFVGGEMVDRGNIAIANTSNPRIYQTERWGMTSYELPVTNGSYTVKLHFAETYTGITGLGQRVFSVNVEGVTLGDIDIFAETGGINRALVKSVPVTVADGRLDLTFTASANNAAINGIEVIP